MHHSRLLGAEPGGRPDFAGGNQLVAIVKSNLGAEAEAGNLHPVAVVLVVLVKLVLGAPVDHVEVEVAIVVDIGKGGALGADRGTLHLRLLVGHVDEVALAVVQVELVGQLAVAFVQVEVAVVVDIAEGRALAPALFAGGDLAGWPW